MVSSLRWDGSVSGMDGMVDGMNRSLKILDMTWVAKWHPNCWHLQMATHLPWLVNWCGDVMNNQFGIEMPWFFLAGFKMEVFVYPKLDHHDDRYGWFNPVQSTLKSWSWFVYHIIWIWSFHFYLLSSARTPSRKGCRENWPGHDKKGPLPTPITRVCDVYILYI